MLDATSLVPTPQQSVESLRVHSDSANRVVVNARGDHSLWPAEGRVPDGWREIGVVGSRDDCLAYIAREWHPVRLPGSAPSSEPITTFQPPTAAPRVHPRSSAAQGSIVPLPRTSIHALIRRTNESAPAEVALRCLGRTVTRGELNQRVASWSAELLARGAQFGTPIAMLVPRSIEAVVAILAILESGSPYLPLSSRDSTEQLLRILSDADNPMVVADAEQAARLTGYLGTLICSSDLDSARPAEPRERVAPEVGFDDLAYVMYTSGTSGEPKGVTGTHGQLVNYVRWCAEQFAQLPGEQTILHAPLHFLGSVMTVFTPLFAGWEITVAPESLDIAGLIALTASAPCGFFKITPSHVRAMTALGSVDRIARRVMITSETLYMTPELSRWIANSPDSRFVNQYGMSETCGSTCWSIPEQVPVGARIPVGRPIFNAQAYIVGMEGELSPLGEVGELCMAGAVIGDGYHGRPALTAERWIPNPYGPPGSRLLRTGDLARMDDSGTVDIIGRADRQVKVRGHRVELPSIEQVLRSCAGIGDAVVLPIRDRNPVELIAYLRPVGEAWPTLSQLRQHVGRSLPDAAIPSKFAYVATFPITANGKFDQQRLPTCETLAMPQETLHEAPANALEATVCRVFASVLEVEAVGVSDNFFELGGNSLLVIEAATQLEDELGLDVTVGALFDNPRPRALAAALSEQSSSVEAS